MNAVSFRIAEEPARLDDLCFATILDRLDRAMTVVDADLQVYFANTRALEIAQRSDAIAVAEGRLSFVARPMQSRVCAFLQRAAFALANDSHAASFRSPLPRSSGA